MSADGEKRKRPAFDTCAFLRFAKRSVLVVATAYFFFRLFVVSFVGAPAIVGVRGLLRDVGIVEVVFAVDAPAVQHAYPYGVLGAAEGAPGAHYALVGKVELVLLLVVGYVLHGAVVHALHTADTVVRHSERHAVYAHCGVFYAQRPRHHSAQKGLFEVAFGALQNFRRVYGNERLRRLPHFVRLLVGVTENHVVGHYVVILVGQNGKALLFELCHKVYRGSVVHSHRLAGGFYYEILLVLHRRQPPHKSVDDVGGVEAVNGIGKAHQLVVVGARDILKLVHGVQIALHSLVGKRLHVFFAHHKGVARAGEIVDYCSHCSKRVL